MTIQVDKWVAAGIAAVKWSGLADMRDPEAVARLCDFLDFHVADLWVRANPEAYLLGLEQGFEPLTPLPREQAIHAIEHVALVLRSRANQLDQVDPAALQRIMAVITPKRADEPDAKGASAARQGSAAAPGFAGTD
jgi:hypothetical protein